MSRPAPEPAPAEERIRLRRVYEEPAAGDGTRILVDRLWPRGLERARAHLDHWLKEVAPSDDLRHWFGHEPSRWAEFQKRYRAEIAADPAPLEKLAGLCREGPVTLLFAAHDARRNNAVALREVLLERLRA